MGGVQAVGDAELADAGVGVGWGKVDVISVDSELAWTAAALPTGDWLRFCFLGKCVWLHSGASSSPFFKICFTCMRRDGWVKPALEFGTMDMVGWEVRRVVEVCRI